MWYLWHCQSVTFSIPWLFQTSDIFNIFIFHCPDRDYRDIFKTVTFSLHWLFLNCNIFPNSRSTQRNNSRQRNFIPKNLRSTPFTRRMVTWRIQCVLPNLPWYQTHCGTHPNHLPTSNQKFFWTCDFWFVVGKQKFDLRFAAWSPVGFDFAFTWRHHRR